jgi:hypothetical protein
MKNKALDAHFINIFVNKKQVEKLGYSVYLYTLKRGKNSARLLC